MKGQGNGLLLFPVRWDFCLLSPFSLVQRQVWPEDALLPKCILPGHFTTPPSTSGPRTQSSLFAPEMLPKALLRQQYKGIYGTGHLPGGKECVLYMGLKCPCCSEKGDSEKTKSVPFIVAKFPSHCCVWARRCPESDHTGWCPVASVAKQMALVIKSPGPSGRCLAGYEGHGALL